MRPSQDVHAYMCTYTGRGSAHLQLHRKSRRLLERVLCLRLALEKGSQTRDRVNARKSQLKQVRIHVTALERLFACIAQPDMLDMAVSAFWSPVGVAVQDAVEWSCLCASVLRLRCLCLGFHGTQSVAATSTERSTDRPQRSLRCEFEQINCEQPLLLAVSCNIFGHVQTGTSVQGEGTLKEDSVQQHPGNQTKSNPADSGRRRQLQKAVRS